MSAPEVMDLLNAEKDQPIALDKNPNTYLMIFMN